MTKIERAWSDLGELTQDGIEETCKDLRYANGLDDETIVGLVQLVLSNLPEESD